YVTKRGAHGTLYKFAIDYKDRIDPGFGTARVNYWAYDMGHAQDRFWETQDESESWVPVRIAKVETGQIEHRWVWHTLHANTLSPAATTQLVLTAAAALAVGAYVLLMPKADAAQAPQSVDYKGMTIMVTQSGSVFTARASNPMNPSATVTTTGATA